MTAAARLLIVGAVPPPAGGVATHCRELQRALEWSGLSVEVLDPRRRGPDGSDGRTRLLARLLWARARRDLVHLHTNGHNRGSWRLAGLCAALAPAPRLLTLHSGLAPPFVRSHNKLVRLICGRYTQLIAVNQEIAAALIDAGVAPARIAVVPAFTPAALAFRLPPPGLAQLRRRHPLLLACALAPGPEYGAMVMLDAFKIVHAHNNQAGLILFGPGTHDPALAVAVRARGLAGAVHQLGELARERALAIVAACDAFVRPTLADGDAISVREALALGRPVVASAVGARPAGARLFAAGDAAACAELLFHTVAQRLPERSPPVDCLPALMSIYQRLGARIEGVAIGTSLATVT
jgi:glycosyltransferase involved in cell wall biosynthesis